MRKSVILLHEQRATTFWSRISNGINEPTSRIDKRLSAESSDLIRGSSLYCDTKTVRYRRVPDSVHKSFSQLSLSEQRQFTSTTSPLISKHSYEIHTLQASMLTRAVSSLLSVTQRVFYGTSSPGPTEIKMDTGEKLIHSKGIKQVEIRACGRLYSELVKSRPILFSGVPKDSGILFKVDYYDSIDIVKNIEAPVICILHGSPGHYQEFSSLINFLTTRGIRVLAPNFPDYNATYQHGFRHSPRERLDFLLEFLKALKVTKLDMLIGHSGSVYTVFELLDHSLSEDTCKWSTTSQDFKVQVKSLGLFSTPSHRLPNNLAVTPFRLLSLRLFDYALFRPLMLACIDWWVRVQGIKNRVDVNKIENLLIAASTIGYSEHDKMGPRLDLLRSNKVPVLMVYGTKDRLINLDTFEQLQRDLGAIDEASIKVYRSDGSLEKGRSELGGKSDHQQFIEVSRFNEGGHYVFQRYSHQINEDVHDFLRHKVLIEGVGSQATRL